METERVEKNLREMIGNLSDEADDNRSGRLNEIRKKRMRIIKPESDMMEEREQLFQEAYKSLLIELNGEPIEEFVLWLQKNGANKKERGFISKKGEEYSGELYLNEDNELKIRYRK